MGVPWTDSFNPTFSHSADITTRKTATVLVAIETLYCRLLELIRRKSSTKTNLKRSMIKKKKLAFYLILLVRFICEPEYKEITLF